MGKNTTTGSSAWPHARIAPVPPLAAAMTATYPRWVVLHVPHDSTHIPNALRDQFVLDDRELAEELDLMTDHHTRALFLDPSSRAAVVRAPVSRLVVDVERFVDDAREPMAARGMGVVYTKTSRLQPLRRRVSEADRLELIQAYYAPHHAALEEAVANSIERDGHCLVIDCHSFPGRALPYELADPDATRPDICIGTDGFHTRDELAQAFVGSFRRAGWTVAVNDPFAGSMVPASRYRRDRRVEAIMVEVNRDLYLRPGSAEPSPEFDLAAQRIRGCCTAAIEAAGLLEDKP